MGFNKRYIPDLETLKERRKEYTNDEDFLSSVVGKADALIGPPDSMSFLDSIYDKIKEDKNDSPNRESGNRGL